MLGEHKGDLPAEHIAQRTSAAAGNRTHGNTHARIVYIARLNGHLSAQHSENSQAQRIGNVYHHVHRRPLFCRRMVRHTHQQEHSQCGQQRRHNKFPVGKQRRRNIAQQKVADHAAAHCRDQPHEQHAKDIQSALNGRSGARKCKCYRSDPFRRHQHPLCKIHF